jgi:hypothetical protein
LELRRPVNERRAGNFARENIFIVFVDRMFTTFVRRTFTNAIDAKREVTAISCL